MHDDDQAVRRPAAAGQSSQERKVLVAPSVLSANFGALADAVRLVGRIGGDFVHLDVMDGCFVPQITFGQKAVMDLRPVSELPFDIHLMICRPENAIEEFCDRRGELCHDPLGSRHPSSPPAHGHPPEGRAARHRNSSLDPRRGHRRGPSAR